MNSNHMLLKLPKVELRLMCMYLRTVAEKQMVQQTTPEEMSVSKEPPPSKQPSNTAQTGTDCWSYRHHRRENK